MSISCTSFRASLWQQRGAPFRVHLPTPNTLRFCGRFKHEAPRSTVEQIAGLEAQEQDLTAAGVAKVFTEQISAVDAKRPALAAALDFARQGDVFVVTKIDRLARSVADLLALVEKLTAKGVALKILAMNVDTSTPTGKLMISVVGAVAEFERAIMLER